MAGIPSNYRKYIRPLLGIVILILGITFMFFPFIPLGYIFTAAAIILLSYELPFVRRFVAFLKQRGNAKSINKIEEEVNSVENQIDDYIIEDHDEMKRE